MRVLVAVLDPVRLGFLCCLLRDAGIEPLVLDGQISALEGGIGAFPRRLAVRDADASTAIAVLRDAGELPPPVMTVAGETQDTLLGGRVHLRQPLTGLRAGLDAVMLAASVPAQPGQAVLELGCGTGAAFLCLMARVSGLRVTAIERDRDLADYACDNATRNGHGSLVEIVPGDATTVSALGPFDHSFTNPPWWPGASDSPSRRRAAATHTGDGPCLGAWVATSAKFLRRSGTATAILPASLLDSCLGAMRDSGLGGLRVIPLWPRQGREAKRILVSGVKASRSPTRLLPGLILHDATGWSGAASAVLREGRALAEVLTGAHDP